MSSRLFSLQRYSRPGFADLRTNAGLMVLVLITIICVFVPFSPDMPRGGLDPSWMFGLNQAVDQGLAFGREIVFTYGPYAAIYTMSYHPATDAMMILGAFYVGTCYAAAILLLARDCKWYLLVALWIFFAIVLNSGASLYLARDVLLFSYPLLVGILCCLGERTSKLLWHRRGYAIAMTTALFFPLGLLPLIKASLLVLCATIAFLVAIFLVVERKVVQAAAAVCAPLAGIFLFWTLAGQSPADLPRYIASSAEMISGYTEAMALPGPSLEIGLFLLAAAMFPFAVLRESSFSVSSRLFLTAIFATFLFVAFKSGFVRHEGHAAISGKAICLAAIFLALIVLNGRTVLAFLLSVLTLFVIDQNVLSADATKSGMEKTYASSWDGLVDRLFAASSIEARFADTRTRLKAFSKFPLMQGTTDIYSYNQAFLIASGNKWNPRPVFQSYAALTPALAETNRRHLSGANAPDNVIFSVEPIDARFAAIEDGASWSELLKRYRPSGASGNFLFLRKRSLPATVSERRVITAANTFGKTIAVVDDQLPIMAEIVIRPSLIGKIAGIFYKPSQLSISLSLANGAIKKYRLITSMAKSPFLLSPVVEKTSDFARLYDSTDTSSGQQVVSFSIAPDSADWMWEPTFEVVLSHYVVTTAN